MKQFICLKLLVLIAGIGLGARALKIESCGTLPASLTSTGVVFNGADDIAYLWGGITPEDRLAKNIYKIPVDKTAETENGIAVVKALNAGYAHGGLVLHQDTLFYVGGVKEVEEPVGTFTPGPFKGLLALRPKDADPALDESRPAVLGLHLKESSVFIDGSNSRLYIFGGFNDETNEGTEKIRFISNPATAVATTRPDDFGSLPFALRGSTAVFHENVAYIFGGRRPGQADPWVPNHQIIKYNISSHTDAELINSEEKIDLIDGSAVKVGNEIYVFGYSGGEKYGVYNLESNELRFETVEEGKKIPFKVSSVYADKLRKILLFGGQKATDGNQAINEINCITFPDPPPEGGNQEGGGDSFAIRQSNSLMYFAPLIAFLLLKNLR